METYRGYIFYITYIKDGKLLRSAEKSEFIKSFKKSDTVKAKYLLVVLTQFFKTAYKVGKSFLMAIIPAALGVLVMEAFVHLPGFQWLDSIEPVFVRQQLPILVIGVVIYVIGIFASYKVAASSQRSYRNG